MTIPQQEVGTGLKQKIQALMAAYDQLKEVNLTLEEQNQNLKQGLLLKESALNEALEQINQLQISRAFLANSNDSQDAKTKVNRIVREIDHCIALLNR